MGIQREMVRKNGNGASRARKRTALSRNGTNGHQNGAVKDAPWHSSDFVASEKTPITNFLGWFSIGLGLAEVFAPRAVARLIGVDEERHTRLLRAYGVRELAAGVGILTRPKPTYWMWNRVIGDAVDLASLGRAMRSGANDQKRLGVATLAVLGVTALDIIDSVRLTSEASPATGHDAGSFELPASEDGQVVLRASVTVNRPIEEVYEFWKNPRNYAQFMDHLDSVNPTTAGLSHWKIKGPAGMTVEWDAEIVTDAPNEVIEWRSTSDSTVENTGSVRFKAAPAGRGTIVTLEAEYKPKAGPLGAGIAKAFATIPKTQLKNDLRRFKQLVEIGEVVKSDASAVDKLMHPAQPPARHELEAHV